MWNKKWVSNGPSMHLRVEEVGKELGIHFKEICAIYNTCFERSESVTT